jgi:hypothetical protein
LFTVDASAADDFDAVRERCPEVAGARVGSRVWMTYALSVCIRIGARRGWRMSATNTAASSARLLYTKQHVNLIARTMIKSNR